MLRLVGTRLSSLTIQQAVRQSNVLIVDVRSPEEVAAGGTVTGAINVPVNTVPANMNVFGEDKNRPIIFFCKKGIRAADAAAYVSQFGFKNAFSATDGETVKKLME